MQQPTVRQPLVATTIAILAVVVSLGGGAYASHLAVRASDIVKNAVRAKHIKVDQVRAKHIKAGAVDNAELADEAVTATKLRNGSVTNPKLGNNVITSGPFGITIRREAELDIVSPFTLDVTASCLEGERAITGGARWVDDTHPDDKYILSSEPSGHTNFLGALLNPTSWTATGHNAREPVGGVETFRVFVECLAP